MTGRYQQRFGHEFNPTGAIGLPLTETTSPTGSRPPATSRARSEMASRLEAGTPPQKRGFDESLRFLWAGEQLSDAAAISLHPAGKEMDYTTDAFGARPSAFIEKNKEKPWFLYLAFNAVHTPMHATDDRLAKFPRSPTNRPDDDAMMLAMDDAVGRAAKKLAQTKLDQHTFVIFISDNGGPTMPGATITVRATLPLPAVPTATTLEGGIRVPFLISRRGISRPA